MIEATCAACGTVNRIAEADVPVGAKFVSCTSCKSKVALPQKAATGPAPNKVGIPAIPAKLPTPPKGVPSARPIDLADLPAPKRASPLAGAEPSKPAPRSALAGAELPVPKGGAKAPTPQGNSLDLDDLMPSGAGTSAGLADLPAPKPRPSPLGDLPAAKPKQSALADLPAPKAKPSALTDLPGKPATDDLAAKPALADLPGKPAAAKPAGITDLPAPKLATPPRGVPAKPQAEVADLPAPKLATPPRGVPTKPQAEVVDLPAPKLATPPRGVPTKPQARLADLPAPKLATPPRGVPTKPQTGLTDLPIPKAPVAAKGSLDLEDDMLTPKPGVTDLPTPKPGANADLLAPKGFFDDLPQPAKKQPGGIDLPAPKGFFDDLPQPAPAAKQGGASQEIAPKGFFDDLPQPAPAAKQGGASQDLAPKPGVSQDLAPKGLFDDLPQPGKPAAVAASATGLFDDIQQPTTTAKTPANAALGAGDIDLGPAEGASLELDGPELDLDSSGPDQSFQDLDLSEPSAKAKPIEDGSPIKIKTPAKGAAQKPIPINVPRASGGGGGGTELKLDLADDPHDPAHTGRPAAAKPNQITPKKKATAEADSPEARAAKQRRSRIMLVSLLVLVGLGAGGFYFYQRHAAAKTKAEELARQLQSADKALKAGDAKHWDRARNATEEAIKLDSTNARALGLGAEAWIAGAIDTGVKMDICIGKGREMIQAALGGGHTSPELERAQAVAAIAAQGQAQRAIDLLKAQHAKNPKDGWLQLYFGWAQNAKGDAAEAIKAFDQAMALSPATKVSALYGRGQAKLLLADVEGAKADFAAVLEANKEHVCAQVGLIAAYPLSQSVQQVAELEAVLQRKDLAAQDPRCVVRAYTLIGDVHRIAGRGDIARQRYRDALKLMPRDLVANDGLAAVEMRDGKLELAADHIQKALAVNAEHAETLILQAELSVREGKLPAAESSIEKLGKHVPPLPPLSQAHLLVVKGRLLEAKGQDEDAIAAYTEGAKLAGELDLTPTMAAVKKLSDLAKKAPDPAKAGEYRNRASQLLQALEARAQEDAQLSTALGVAYLESGDSAKAEVFLRRAVALKGDDAEAKLQLAKALNVQGKYDEAIGQLEEALKLDAKRTDIALEVAVTHQNAGHHDAAVAAYEKLLALPDVPIIVRVNAGRYFAKRGLMEKAAEQAVPILKAEPDNPGGLYLKAEGLIKADKPEEATSLLIRASDVDPDAQYLDALGRAYEGRYKKDSDSKNAQGAQQAYERASKADDKMFHPWLGLGKMRAVMKSWDGAILALAEAGKLAPDHSEVLYWGGKAYYGLRAQGEPTKKNSAKWLEAALKAKPELDPATRADAFYMLGNVYEDLNKPGDNVRTWEAAIRLAEEIEKQGGKPPEWLTATYYELGDLYERLHNCSAQKRAFQHYTDRATDKEKNEVRYKEVQRALATSLKSC